ncbi:MAG: hypothetical protein J3Q66DRAFT_335844 [Benniella sp.]|nr:MAG: hypothetical protein J3Q66DRAFT_335844 [Benniella sp.]
MDTDQSNKPPPLPAKLRWRPYANGTSKKNSKLKKTPQQPNPKATAHKIKGQQYYTGKSQRPLGGVQLQWEEAETIESMSHGGHAHPTHPNHHSSRETSPSASSTSSASSSSSPTGATPGGSVAQKGAQNSVSTSTSTGNNSFVNLVHRAVNPLPSPPLKMSNTRLDLVGAQCDLSQIKASVPGLIGNGLLQNGVSLNASVPDTAEAYQVLFNALFQTQTKGTTAVFHTPALIGNSNGGAPLTNPSAAVPAAPMATSSPSALLGSTNINILLSDPDRGLDTNELLGIGSLDELLTSCGYSESADVFNTQALPMLASPISIGANQSFNSSPVSSVLDLNGTSNVSRAPSPALASFSPMAFSNSALEALLSQPVMSQQPSSQQQSPIGTSSALPINDLYSILSQDLSSPFDCLSIGVDPSPAVWTPLFPTMETSATTINTTANTTSQGQLQSRPQRTEMATQTDGPYDPSHSPISAKASTSGSQHSSPLSVPGLSPEVKMNSSWDMPSPPPSGDEFDEKSTEDVKSTQQGRETWNWMDEWLKPSAMTPAGNGMFSSGLGIPNGTIGNGGLIRTLQGTGHRKPSKTNPSAAQGTLADQPKEKDVGKAENGHDRKPETVSKDSIKAKIVPSVESSGPVDKNEPSEVADKKEGLGGLITAMLKSLWIGKNEGDK